MWNLQLHSSDCKMHLYTVPFTSSEPSLTPFSLKYRVFFLYLYKTIILASDCPIRSCQLSVVFPILIPFFDNRMLVTFLGSHVP